MDLIVLIFTILAGILLLIFLSLCIFFVATAVKAGKHYRDTTHPTYPENKQLRFWRCGLCGKCFELEELTEITEHLQETHPNEMYKHPNMMHQEGDIGYYLGLCLVDKDSGILGVPFKNGV